MSTTINLIPYYRRNARVQRIHLRKWGMMCSAYCIAALGVALVLLTQNDTNTAEGLETAIAEAQLELESRAERVGGLQQRVNEAARLHAATQVRYPQPDWSILLGVFTACGSDAILLDGTSIEPRFGQEARSNARNVHILESPTSFAVTLSGWSESQRAVSDYLLSLERTALFEHLTLTESTRQAFRTGDAIRFRIEATLINPGSARP